MGNKYDNYVNEAIDDRIEFFMIRDPFFGYVFNNPDKLTEPIIKGLLSNLQPLKQAGDEYLEGLATRLDKTGNGRLATLLRDSKSIKDVPSTPMGYETLAQLGYPGEVLTGSPVGSVLLNYKEVAFKKRGFPPNCGFNANIFASYILTRITLVQLENGQILAYDRRGYYKEIKDNLLKIICRDILHEAEKNLWCRKMEAEYFEAIKREIPYVTEMNPVKDYINLPNGMLNLYTMEVKPHSPDFLSTIQISIEYAPDATCPLFVDFLDDIFEGDQQRVDLIQELLGYCFLPEIKIQKAFIFLGPGSNGKSVLAEIIRHLVGIPNVSNVALSEMSGRFGLQNLPGKLVNISSENEFNKKFNTQNFKLLTGGDAVNVEQKYKDSFNTDLFVKLILLLNRVMDSDDITNAYYRRIQLIPFNKIYRELKANETPKEGISYMDKTLKGKLLQELPGILNFSLEGLARLIANDFNLTESKVCEEALEDYKNEQNPVIEYFKDQIKVNPSAKVLRSDYKKNFSLWAATNGYDDVYSMSSTKFWDSFRKVLLQNNISFNEKKIKGNIYIEGLEILSNLVDDEYVSAC